MNWQTEIQQAIRSPRALAEALALEPEKMIEIFKQSAGFPLQVPLSFVSRMKKGDWADPLLRQVLPSAPSDLSGFVKDPLLENGTKTNVMPGLLHKYWGRVLILATGRCAIHCQYCFRQNFPYEEQGLGKLAWQNILLYISENTEIHEVIFSGGDPLVRHDDNWQNWLSDLDKIPHVKTVRFHTRMPVVIPSRLTDELLQVLQSTRLKPIVILHSNHPQEWNEELTHAVRPFAQKGLVMLNHAVLMKGVNDDCGVLVALSHALWSAGVLPYYVNRLDPVKGAEDFEVSPGIVAGLQKEMRESLPGYLVPRFVHEKPGQLSKQPWLS